MLINESGLYSLILSSKLPSAKRFKRWVTSEVLPAIRKHGVFVMDDIVNNMDALIEALQAFKAERLQKMNEYLHVHGIQFKQGGRIWILYQKYTEMGLTSTKTHTYSDNNGTIHTKEHTYWTQKGRLFIYDLLKGKGILPIIEQEG